MKKLSLILVAIFAVALFSTSAFAIDTGKWRVGGGASGNYMSIEPEGEDSFSLMTLTGEVGYFVTSNIEVGLGLSYINADFGADYLGSGSPSSITATVIRPYGKYYFPMGDNAWFAGIGYNLATFDVGSSYDVNGFSVLGGYSIKLNTNASVDITAIYDMLTVDETGGGDVNIMGVGASFSLWL